MNLMTVLEKKVFISSKPSIVCLMCPPPCGPFSIQESAVGGLSYKVKKDAESLPRPHIYLALSSLTFGAVSLIPYTVNRLSKSTFVWWLKMLSEPFTKSSSDNAMSIYNLLTQRSMIDFYLEFKLSPMHCYLKESQMAVRYTFVCSILILHIR